MSRLRHGPVAGEKIRRPPVVTNGLEGRIQRDGQGVLRTGLYAVVIRLGAVGADAPVVEGPHGQAIALGSEVHAIGTHLHASSTGNAGGGPMDHVFPHLVAITRRCRPDLTVDLCLGNSGLQSVLRQNLFQAIFVYRKARQSFPPQDPQRTLPGRRRP